MFSRRKAAASSSEGGGIVSDVSRMVRGKPVIDEELVSRELQGLRQRDVHMHEREQQLIAELRESDEAQRKEIEQLKQMLQAAQGELEKSRASELQLKQGLNLAADRLYEATTAAAEMKREHDIMESKLRESQADVQELARRLEAEHGVRFHARSVLGSITPENYAAHHSPEKLDAPMASLIAKAAGGGPDARKAEARHAKQQMKRLLHFVKEQLAADLQRWRDETSHPQHLADEIGRRRALASQLDLALQQMCEADAPLPNQGHAGAGGGAAIRVQGKSLPRTVAVDDSARASLTLASGPAVKWELSAPNASSPPAGIEEASRADSTSNGGEAADCLRWMVGQPLQVHVRALDEMGVLDDDFDAVVLLEGPEGVKGRGLMSVTSGVAKTELCSQRSGDVAITLVDGCFTRMEPPPPLRIRFVGGAAVSVVCVAVTEFGSLQSLEHPTARVGESVPVSVQAQDCFGNVAPEFNGEVVVCSSHEVTGAGAVKLIDGVAHIMITSKAAGDVAVSVNEVRGVPHIELPERPNELRIKYTPTDQAVIQLQLPHGWPSPVGQRVRLQVVVADAFGNQVPSTVATDVRVLCGSRGNASVERGGQVSLIDGVGEVWVRSETAVDPSLFWLQQGSATSPLALRHTEDHPFECHFVASAPAQLSVHMPSTEPVRVLQPMVVAVRAEDAFGNPVSGWSGKVSVICHGAGVWRQGSSEREAIVVVDDGYGTLELHSEVAETFELSLASQPTEGLRASGRRVRATFAPLEGVLAVFGDMEAKVYPVGSPVQVPLQVVDRLGNVAEEFSGEFGVTLQGAARVAGNAPSVFKVVGGRAMLPVLTTKAERVEMSLQEDCVINPSEATSPKLSRFSKRLVIDFGPAAASRLLMVTLSNWSQSRQEDPTKMVAGEDLIVCVSAVDAYDNLCEDQECTFFLEAESIPQLDDALESIIARRREPPQRYLLQLSKGKASQKVPVRIAGELWIRLLQPSAHQLDVSATKRLKVCASPAVSVDVVNLPEQGHVGVDFEIVVRALDQFGKCGLPQIG